MYNELGTEQLHIKYVKNVGGQTFLELTIGQYKPNTFDTKNLSDLIKLLQEAERLFGLQAIPTGFNPTPKLPFTMTLDGRTGTI